MKIEMEPIGKVHTECKNIPRHWTVSNVKGKLIISKKYLKGMKDIHAGQRIVVLFCFHKSPPFEPRFLCQIPPHRNKKLGVFSICSPLRPNPIGMSVLEVTGIKENVIGVKGIDMLDGTPILDIKPFVKSRHDCPSNEKRL